MLLIDTYDTERAARRVVGLAPRLAAEGIRISGVRIDSGDLGQHARRVRRILDEGGLESVTIVASGGLDEDELLALRTAPIDSFGVGTSLTTSSDAPALDCAYKLQEYAGRPRRKRSEGRRPGRAASRSGGPRRRLANLPAMSSRLTANAITGCHCCSRSCAAADAPQPRRF